MPSPLSNSQFARLIGQMFGAISRAASSCPKGGVHRFQGYPRERSTCRQCAQLPLALRKEIVRGLAGNGA
ncbi:hypothetical protein LCGC14_0942320 [marine sediment metagenome]|uniref:Uncharacterized protein n=1 Tax=marine sediment metagenome TaxID=412755 RepID=A0A0F9RR36_9ZZZZ